MWIRKKNSFRYTSSTHQFGKLRWPAFVVADKQLILFQLDFYSKLATDSVPFCADCNNETRARP